MAQRKPHTTKGSESPITAIRLAVGETQDEFAKRLGINIRTLRRYELENKLPGSDAVKRPLKALAKKHDITYPE